MSLKRLTDLFEEGVVLPVTAKNGTVVPLWIAKLTPFEVEQSNHEGRVARARRMLAIREVGTPEYALFEAEAADVTKDDLINALVADKANEFLVSAMRAMRSDEEWKERLEVLEWSQDQLRGLPDDHEDVKLLAKVSEEYQAELSARLEVAGNDYRLELSQLPEEDVREKYRDSYVEQRGLAAFTSEQQKSQIYLSLRVCEATKTDEGWVHAACNHQQRWLDGPEEVEAIPDALLQQVRVAYAEMSMTPDVARFSEGPASSSASSGPSSKQEDSVASGPVETPDAPVGISS